MRISGLTPSDRCDWLKAAVIGHYRWWLKFDGILLSSIAPHSLHTSDSIKSIAKEYSVARGMKGSSSAGSIAQLVNLIPSGDITNLVAPCLKAVDLARTGGLTHNSLVSGMTKFLWFRNPQGWTMFDKFAADALGIQNGPPLIRMPAFYATLSSKNFLVHEAQIQSIVSSFPQFSLYASKIIDIYMIIVGKGDKAVLADNLHFLGLLPRGTARDISDLAADIAVKQSPSLLYP